MSATQLSIFSSRSTPEPEPALESTASIRRRGRAAAKSALNASGTFSAAQPPDQPVMVARSRLDDDDGDIAASYSADVGHASGKPREPGAPLKIRQPFRHDLTWFTCMGLLITPTFTRADCYPLLNPADAAKLRRRKYSYQGERVFHHSTGEAVLGPKWVFQCEPRPVAECRILLREWYTGAMGIRNGEHHHRRYYNFLRRQIAPNLDHYEDQPNLVQAFHAEMQDRTVLPLCVEAMEQLLSADPVKEPAMVQSVMI